MEFQDILVYIIVAVAVVIWGISLVRSLVRISSSRGKRECGDEDRKRGCDGNCNNCL
ncbi:MAG: hypothetical protein R3Y68_08135 [Rikenellaceae bacterium]